jgi:hypothetical protein
MVHDADVGEIEFRGTDHAALRPLGIGGEPTTEERVLENLKIAFHRRSGDAAVARDRREVDELGVGQ